MEVKIALTKWEVARLLEALSIGSQRSEDHDLWLKIKQAEIRFQKQKAKDNA